MMMQWNDIWYWIYTCMKNWINGQKEGLRRKQLLDDSLYLELKKSINKSSERLLYKWTSKLLGVDTNLLLINTLLYMQSSFKIW